MSVVVITGSTRGIGYGLADSFLALGCAVAVSSRTPADVERGAGEFSARYGADNVLGHPCDVTVFAQVQDLWDAAKARFGKIDIWINNAGISHSTADLWALAPDLIDDVVATNLTGALYGAKVALTGMLAQGFGGLYNMEGLGSDGRRQKGLTLYGCTKSALAYLTDALVEETRGTPVLVGALRPGMVATRFVTDRLKERPEEFEQAKRILNIICDRAETVTPWLACRVLENEKHGARLNWLTRSKLMARFFTAPFRQRDVFGE